MNYIDDYPSCTRTYATFIVYTGKNSPNQVTSALGLNPTRTSEAETSPRKTVNGWYLNTRDLLESRDSRRHIDHLLSLLTPLSSKIKTLQDEGMVTQIHCFWESASGNGGPTVSPSQMTAMGALDIELIWDIWFFDNVSE